MPKAIYRYKFTHEIMEKISEFSKQHCEYDKNDYKDAWNKWVEKNKSIINEEMIRLKNLGYKDDIHKKMYTAGRYYFRKKEDKTKTTDTKNPRTYIKISNFITTKMKEDIIDGLNQENYKPSKGYELFSKKYSDEILKEINDIKINNSLTIEVIKSKIKKTYKNIYNNLSKK